ncbi:unnamed protein product [Pleuronectes platessa]|uniref:Uncharacterized protein n=1 Tax=Pleuronectes platessa TaxID=8262 RepID=A0A9N7VBR6_PLEPL|nr:unnamed protein product [Pleuronectes platessa]
MDTRGHREPVETVAVERRGLSECTPQPVHSSCTPAVEHPGREGLQDGVSDATGDEERGSDRRQLLHTVSRWQCHTWQLSITALPDITGAAAKHAVSGVIHPHMSIGSTLTALILSLQVRERERKRGKERGERKRGEREGSIHLFTYGKESVDFRALPLLRNKQNESLKKDDLRETDVLMSKMTLQEQSSVENQALHDATRRLKHAVPVPVLVPPPALARKTRRQEGGEVAKDTPRQKSTARDCTLTFSRDLEQTNLHFVSLRARGHARQRSTRGKQISCRK